MKTCPFWQYGQLFRFESNAPKKHGQVLKKTENPTVKKNLSTFFGLFGGQIWTGFGWTGFEKNRKIAKPVHVFSKEVNLKQF